MTIKDVVDLEKEVIDIIKSRNPSSIEELSTIISADSHLSKDEAIKLLITMEDKGIIRFSEIEKKPPEELSDYIRKNGVWYLVTVTLATISSLSVMLFTNQFSTTVFIRYILGSILVLFLPGYSFMRNLFVGSSIGMMKGLLLSVGISLMITSVIGLALNYITGGISMMSLVILLFLVVLISSTIGFVRERANSLKIEADA